MLEMFKIKFYRYLWFVLIGALGSLFVLGGTYVLTEFLHWWYLLAYVLATFVAWTAVFFLNAQVTFKDHNRDHYLQRYLSFFGLYTIIGLVNFGLVFLLTSVVGLYYLLSIVLVVVPLSLFNFWVNQIYIFNST
ncbi:MAG: hypothetical protein A2571_01425 [Candidatus Vogelbacteria bacterium RIFOXYD1_FULL_44_32]|uniref:GtrA/DPMS transmembrane domain-containing protein n=1 Tax=Candidatus Vogelbacteria bacterium RIFOXYD1_FULL_44_32 TaxID=1802438 RepID=A0A1G2QEJ8_9BACT|nr:MAG: hypothetical protein A2571_01425 [Candidatus Vogelbacteria bacterium RIFOXYD1_FULL_44_32]